ncbi:MULTISPECIES: hypothetical protein [unclassified Sphingomonas]|uniref:hypothetical protein n=1 Tax=unclassified Sphingomonas TaxID=196159 RepID=UPI0035A89992
MAVIAIAPTIGGCTIITVSPESRVTSIRPGILKIEPAAGAGMIAYRVRGLGVVAGRSGPTLGWASEDTVLVYEKARCGIIVFDQPKNAEAMTFWRNMAKDRPDICVMGEKE